MLPNGPQPCVHRGAHFGFHGEATLLPWDVAIAEDDPERVSVVFSVRLNRIPLHVSKTLTLECGRPTLFLSERITNEAGQRVELLWGHHPTFGAPLLAAGARVFVPPCDVTETLPPDARLRPGQRERWPRVVEASAVHAEPAGGQAYWGSRAWGKEQKHREISTEYPAPQRRRYVYSRTIDTVIVKITTDDGRTGYGEAKAPVAPEVTKQIIDLLLRDIVMGADPRDVVLLWERVYAGMRVRGHAAGFYLEAISGREAAAVPAAAPAEQSAPGSEWRLWKEVLADRRAWLLTASRMLTDPVWYFYLFWFPKYLSDARGFDLRGVGRVAWIVYLAADAGSILGGWLSGALIRRGLAPNRARVLTMTAVVAIVPLGGMIAFGPRIEIVLLLGALVAFGHLTWQVTLGALIVDNWPPRTMATVFGLVAAGSGLGGLLSTDAIGRLVTAYSYTPVFALMALLHPIALLLIRAAVRRHSNEKA